MNKITKDMIFDWADKFEYFKEQFNALFKSYVQDRSIPIKERIVIWECFAQDALPIAEYRDQVDQKLLEFITLDYEPYKVVRFQDLAEQIIPDDVWASYFDDDAEHLDPEGCVQFICEQHPEYAEKFEAFFASDFSGFVNYW